MADEGRHTNPSQLHPTSVPASPSISVTNTTLTDLTTSAHILFYLHMVRNGSQLIILLQSAYYICTVALLFLNLLHSSRLQSFSTYLLNIQYVNLYLHVIGG